MITVVFPVFLNSKSIDFGLFCGISPNSIDSLFQVTAEAVFSIMLLTVFAGKTVNDINPKTAANKVILTVSIIVVFKNLYLLLVVRFEQFKSNTLSIGELLTDFDSLLMSC